MTEFHFSIIVVGKSMTDEQILDAADALGIGGCTDASICGHHEGMELQFDRGAESLEAAIMSAVTDVERSGFCVARVELQRESIPAA